MPVLDRVSSPADVRALNRRELRELTDEIRVFLVEHVSRTGGHLGPNLGVVELTIALHRVFDSPHDPIIFDTGHQSYVHKILTGRKDKFDTLRQGGGLSGYPSRAESEHDWVENSHASTSLSWAEGLAKGFRYRGESRTVVAVIGDGALTGGMPWEALNNIAVDDNLPLVIVVNDNGRSYTRTVGAFAVQLATMRTDRRYEQTMQAAKKKLSAGPFFGRMTYSVLHAVKIGVKDVVSPQGMFADLGMKYLGPIDGHDLQAVERALVLAKRYGGPVIVHCVTQKGRGYKAAEEDLADHFHTVGRIHVATGKPIATKPRTWTDAFAEELVRIGETDDRVVAITAAMMQPTGLNRFQERFPDRVIDVGIAEQHAVTMAAGLAAAGMHPVFAVYATFLNRGFDQILLDVALHRLGVTFILDRAGITGPDGPSHNGVWDLSLMGIVPGIRVAAPRDEPTLIATLRQSIAMDDAPTVIRYSKETLPSDIPAVAQRGAVDILHVPERPQALLIGYGQFTGLALSVAAQLEQLDIGATVIDPVWIIPVADDVVQLAAEHDLVVTMEDNGLAGGMGSQVRQALGRAQVQVPVLEFGVPRAFQQHDSRKNLMQSLGLNPKDIAAAVARQLS